MRKLKVFGLSAFAALAVSVASVPASSAAEGTFVVAGAGVYTATQVGNETFTLPGGRTLTCKTMEFSGAVANGARTLTGIPTWDNCHAKVGLVESSATVTFTACDYGFSDLTTTAANTYAAKTAIACEAGKAIHIALYTATDPHDDTTLLCEYTIDPQSGLTGVHFTDNPGNTLTIKWTEVSFAVTKSFGPVVNCGGANSTSKLKGETLLTPAAGTTIDIDD